MTAGEFPSGPRTAANAAPGEVDVVLCDLDGVVWLRREAIPGAADAVAELRAAGCRVLFVTNNSMSTVADQEAALAAIGIPAVGDVVTSAQAGARLVAPGEHVAIHGGVGITESVTARGATIVPGGRDEPAPDAIVVGLDLTVSYDSLDRASHAVRRGARFVACNDDATFPTPDGPTPGAGTIVAAIERASGTTPIVAGKPHRPMADLVAERVGPSFDPARTVVIGDRLDTDGAFAHTVGCPFVLVRTGVTPPDADLTEIVGDTGLRIGHDVADIGAFAAAVTGAIPDRPWSAK